MMAARSAASIEGGSGRAGAGWAAAGVEAAVAADRCDDPGKNGRLAESGQVVTEVDNLGEAVDKRCRRHAELPVGHDHAAEKAER